MLHRLPNKVHKQLFGRHKLGFRAAGAGLPRSVVTAAAVTVLPASGGGSGGSGGPVSIVLCSHCLRQLQGLPQLGPVEGGGRFGRNLSQHSCGRVCDLWFCSCFSDGQDKVTDRQENLPFILASIFPQTEECGALIKSCYYKNMGGVRGWPDPGGRCTRTPDPGSGLTPTRGWQGELGVWTRIVGGGGGPHKI